MNEYQKALEAAQADPSAGNIKALVKAAAGLKPAAPAAPTRETRKALAQRALVEAISHGQHSDNAVAQMLCKAATDAPPMSTTDNPLVRQNYIDVLAEVAQGSLLLKLIQMPGIMLMQMNGLNALQIPFRKSDSKPKLSWTPENSPIPLSDISLGADSFMPAKAGVIISYSEQVLARYRAFPQLLADAVRSEVAPFLDRALLSDAAPTAAAPLAGLLHGATQQAATTAPEMDIVTARHARPGLPGPYALILPTSTRDKLAAKRDGNGLPMYPTLAAGMLAGYPVVTTEHLTDKIILLDLSRTALAMPELSIDRSTSATLHMSSAPVADIMGNQPVTSNFQTAVESSRFILWCGWAAVRSDSPAATVITSIGAKWEA